MSGPFCVHRLACLPWALLSPIFNQFTPDNITYLEWMVGLVALVILIGVLMSALTQV